MVYRVVGDFTNDVLNEIFNTLTEKYYIMYWHGNFYIGLKNLKNEINMEQIDDIDPIENIKEIKDNLKRELKQKLSEIIEDFWIKDYSDLKDSDNQTLNNEDPFVKSWIIDNLNKLRKQQIEIFKQKELKEIWKNLDEIEENLKERVLKQKETEGNNEINKISK